MPPPLPPQKTAPLSQGTISLTAKQFTAMMTCMGTLEATVTLLNVSASQPQSQCHVKKKGFSMTWKFLGIFRDLALNLVSASSSLDKCRLAYL